MAIAKQEAEIIPPDKDEDATDQADATARAGAHLRMPPFIDNEGGWRTHMARLVGSPVSAFFSLTYHSGKNLIGGLLYRLTLLTLVGTALAVTGYGIYQARHMALPQFDSFWHKEEGTEVTMVGVTNNEPAKPKLPFTPDETDQSLLTAPDRLEPSDDLVDLQRQLQALNAPAALETLPAAEIQEAIEKKTVSNDAALSALTQQYAELQEKYSRLLKAHTASQEGAQNELMARAALGDLLLRLDAGAPYDDLLEGGALARVLRRSEWTLLALFADRGIPTRPALLARFELWTANAAIVDGDVPRAMENGFYSALLDWLRKRAGGLVQVRQAPLATANGDIALIAGALQRGRNDEASWRMGALLRRLETDRSINHPDLASLQLLYDDTRAAAELSPMLASLRDDYMAGARP